MFDLFFYVEFIAAVILLFGLGWLTGRIFKLENPYRYTPTIIQKAEHDEDDD